MEQKTYLTTRYSETGQDGIIHHSSFVVYLEVARVDFFQNLIGINISELEQQGTFCPVVELSIKYLKTVLFLDHLLIQTSLQNLSKVRFSLQYKVMRGDELVATATSSHCFLNSHFKPKRIPKPIFPLLLKCQDSL